MVASLACAPLAAAVPLQSVQLSGSEDTLRLAPQAQVLEDPSLALDLADVRSAQRLWQVNSETALRFDLSRSAWWVKFRLTNDSMQAHEFVVDLNSSRQDHVRWIVASASGEVLLDRTTGDRLERSTRLVDTRGMALPLKLKAQETVDVYFRLQSHDGLFESVGLNISEREAYYKNIRRHDILLSIYFGALLALGLYNLFLFLSTRGREFAAYVVYIFNLLVWNLSYLGFSFEFLLPTDPVLNHKLVLISAGTAYAGIAWFVLSYLRLKETMPGGRALRLYKLSMILNVFPVGLAMADHYLAAVVAGLLNGMPMLIGTFAISVHLSLKGRRDARFLAIAMGSLSLGAAAFYLELFGLVPNAAFTNFGIQMGSFVEMLLLAFGLADSMNTLKAQKLLAEQQALEAQKALTTDLEQQVRARTRALEKANLMLGEMAITDELTGAFNRRHFNTYSEEALRRQARGEAMAFCMFDIDHFKRYNDRYGHQAGDAVLRDVSHVVSQALKRSDDHLFRLGGEEFGVLFGAKTLDKARDFMGSLRLAIRSLERPHEDSPLGIVTASFGVVWWPSESAGSVTPGEMYAAADTFLYDAKKDGRDRVHIGPLPANQAAPVTGLQTALSPA
jgi:diguanylate cyclase (GGDEF)-like protein